MLWRTHKLLITLTLSAKKYGGLSLKKKEGRVRVERGNLFCFYPFEFRIISLSLG